MLWEGAQGEGGSATGVIDLDHAAIADRVVDLAPLVGFYRADAVREIAPADEVDRALLYRATLPMQVAAAAHLRGVSGLRDHALGNSVRRSRKPQQRPAGSAADQVGSIGSAARMRRPTPPANSAPTRRSARRTSTKPQRWCMSIEARLLGLTT